MDEHLGCLHCLSSNRVLVLYTLTYIYFSAQSPVDAELAYSPALKSAPAEDYTE